MIAVICGLAVIALLLIAMFSAGVVVTGGLFLYTQELARILTHNEAIASALSDSIILMGVFGIVAIAVIFGISRIDRMAGKAGWIFLISSMVNAIAWDSPKIAESHAMTIALFIGTIIVGFVIGSLCDGAGIADRGSFAFVVSLILTAFFIFETAYNNLALYNDLVLGVDLTDTQILSLARISFLLTAVIMIIIIAVSILFLRKGKN
jgi:hypothetical protein